MTFEEESTHCRIVAPNPQTTWNSQRRYPFTPQGITQMIYHLLHNAFKFTSEGCLARQSASQSASSARQPMHHRLHRQLARSLGLLQKSWYCAMHPFCVCCWLCQTEPSSEGHVTVTVSSDNEAKMVTISVEDTQDSEQGCKLSTSREQGRPSPILVMLLST